MKLYLYVYVPGFEYDSKGPLHIDVIHLSVTVSGGNNSTSLPVYLYISKDTNEKKEPIFSKISGNLLYRYYGTKDGIRLYRNRKLYNSRYPEDAIDNPSYTEYDELGRVPHGSFYDFITTSIDEETTHHVIGIHNTPEFCLDNVENMNITEHDGLFIVELEELNTDLVFTFTFYSYVGDGSENVGNYKNKYELDDTIIGGWSGNDITEKRPDLFDFNLLEATINENYIKIGTWTQTYNPATSGISDTVEFEEKVFVSQYCHLKDWGEENKSWEIPVNADMLVSDMSNTDNLLTFKEEGSKPIWKQFIYDPITKTHRLPNESIDNEKIDYEAIKEDSSLFYSNFYKGLESRFITPKKEWVTRNYGHMWGYKEAGTYRSRNFLCFADVTIPKSVLDPILQSYNLTYASLDNFDYLYNTPPKITVANLLNDETVGDSNFKQIIASLETIKCNYTAKSYPSDNRITLVTDFLHFNLGDPEHGPNNLESGYASNDPQSVDETATITISCTQEIPNNYNKKVILSDDSCSLDFTNIPSNATYRNYILDKADKKSDFVNGLRKKDTYESSYCWGGYTDDVFQSNTLFKSGETLVELTGSSIVSLNIQINSVKYPMIMWGGTNSESLMAPGQVFRFLDIDDAEIPLYPSYKTDKPPVDENGNPILENTSDSDSDQTSEGNTDLENSFNYKDFIKTYKFGQVNIGLSQMFLINLDPLKTQISYNNLTDHSIVPYIKYKNDFGYLGETITKSNVSSLSKNLLVSEDPSNAEFELESVVSNELSRIHELKYALGSYDSSFCYDKRFLGNIPPNLAIDLRNKLVNLNKGLYVLKILSLYSLTYNPITIVGKFDNTDFAIGSYNSIFLFCAQHDGTELKIEQFNIGASHPEAHNVISGIGLYKVDLDSYDIVTLKLKAAVDKLDDNGYLSYDKYQHIYDSIIFPAIFCAREDMHFCKRNKNYGHSIDDFVYENYHNDYCTEKSSDKIYHYYNASYLPESAVYDIRAFYIIPSGDKTQPSRVVPRNSEDSADYSAILQEKIRR